MASASAFELGASAGKPHENSVLDWRQGSTLLLAVEGKRWGGSMDWRCVGIRALDQPLWVREKTSQASEVRGMVSASRYTGWVVGYCRGAYAMMRRVGNRQVVREEMGE